MVCTASSVNLIRDRRESARSIWRVTRPEFGKLGQCPTENGRVKTEIAYEITWSIDAEFDRAQHQKVHEFQVCGRGDMHAGVSHD